MRSIRSSRSATVVGRLLRASTLTLAGLVSCCIVLEATTDHRAQPMDPELCLAVHRIVDMRTVRFTPVRGPADGPPSDDGFQFYDARFILPVLASARSGSTSKIAVGDMNAAGASRTLRLQNGNSGCSRTSLRRVIRNQEQISPGREGFR